jgi:predicted RNA-binding protein YlqC (UPF0109 family)
MSIGFQKEQNQVQLWKNSCSKMKDTLHRIITSIVEHPDDVSIDESEVDGVVSLVIHAHADDMGRIIGKSGKVIRSIRNVMKIPAIKQNKRIDISISDAQ